MIGLIILGVILLAFLYIFFTLRRAYRRGKARAQDFMNTVVQTVNNNISKLK